MKKFYVVLLTILLCYNYVFSAEAALIHVGVADFIDKTNVSHNALMREITDIFTKILAESSSNIEVIESKSFQVLNGIELKNFSPTGKSADCKYIILGELKKKDINFSHLYEKKGFLYSYQVPKGMIQTHTITLDIRVIEVATGQIIFSTSGTGQATLSENYKNANDYQKQMQKAYTKEGKQKAMDNYNKIQNEAISLASSMASEKICAFLTHEYPNVISIKTKSANAKKSKSKKNRTQEDLGSININRGTLSGVKEHVFYRIFFEGDEVIDFNGNSLGREKFNVAVAEVQTSKNDYCTAQIKGGIFTNIREGDKAEQITAEEAQLIIDNNDFARNRLSEFF